MILIGGLIALVVVVGIIALIALKIMLIVIAVVLAAVFYGSYIVVRDFLLPHATPELQIVAAGALGIAILAVWGYFSNREERAAKKAGKGQWWEGIKTPRYQPCPCGSNLPFYRCHGAEEKPALEVKDAE